MVSCRVTYRKLVCPAGHCERYCVHYDTVYLQAQVGYTSLKSHMTCIFTIATDYTELQLSHYCNNTQPAERMDRAAAQCELLI